MGRGTPSFSQWIGENALLIRQRICGKLGFLGIKINLKRNAKNDALSSSGTGRVQVRGVRHRRGDHDRQGRLRILRLAFLGMSLSAKRSNTGAEPTETARVKTPWRLLGFRGLLKAMKTIQEKLIRSTLVVLFIAVGSGCALAYQHDNKGWFDNQHRHHPFVQHSGHRGYWDHDSRGAKVFINI